MEDLKPKPSFEILTMNITSGGLLKWTSKMEAGALPYIVEQFKWNKWVPVGEVDGLGTRSRTNILSRLHPIVAKINSE